MTCYVGDVRDGLRGFIADGVRAQTCVTSPPYWGLRDYGTAQWDGGDADCKHGPRVMGNANKGAVREVLDGDRTRCHGCGATRVDRQLGLEPTPAEYVANMVEVFRLVRDVLADDGTLWLNIGDSYASGEIGRHDGYNPTRANGTGSQKPFGARQQAKLSSGLKAKDLCGIPWRLAFALQADGWYLRSDIIWHKPNPMPESVTDRPTKAHEYLFLLAKNERYFYDAAAIAEKAVFADSGRESMPRGSFDDKGQPEGREPFRAITETRNRRTVWTVATQPYSEAHFATFPTALVEPCILAGSRPGDVVLDPFMGSGTVAQVAQDLGRRWIGCELNPEYVALQSKRAAQLGMELA